MTDRRIILAYADPLSRYGVSVVHTAGESRIELPRYRPLVSALMLGFGLILLLAAAVGVYETLRATPANRMWFAAVGQPLLFGVGLLVGRLYTLRPIVVRIDAHRLRTNLMPTAKDARTEHIEMPRRLIYNVYATPHAGAVFIRGHNVEMLELSLPYDAASLHAVAKLLRDELGIADE